MQCLSLIFLEECNLFQFSNRDCFISWIYDIKLSVVYCIKSSLGFVVIALDLYLANLLGLTCK